MVSISDNEQDRLEEINEQVQVAVVPLPETVTQSAVAGTVTEPIKQTTTEAIECVSGYYLAEDGSCQDINECLDNNNHCSHQCVNTEGSAHCTCPDGWYLSDLGKQCQGNFGTVGFPTFF